MVWEHYCKQWNVCIHKELTESSAHKICENLISTIIIDTSKKIESNDIIISEYLYNSLAWFSTVILTWIYEKYPLLI